MKKWIGALCSALAGALSLVFLAIPAFKVDYTYATESFSGWKLLNTDFFNDIANWFVPFVTNPTAVSEELGNEEWSKNISLDMVYFSATKRIRA